MTFSILMSVYYKELPEYLEESLRSCVEQTLRPNEIVLVKDGPLTAALDEVIASYVSKYPGLFKIVPLSKNGGLGPALAEGVKHCTHELIARMDSDDISLEDRFEKQINFMQLHKDVAILGGGLNEFRETVGDSGITRVPPAEHDDLIKFARRRCPFNHPTVMFRKTYILEAGSYLPMSHLEDYYLWLRIINKGFRVANLKDVVLYFRTGNDMISRRQGKDYMKREFNFLRTSYREGLLGTYDFYRAVLLRMPARMLPKKMLTFFYETLLRK